MVSTCKCPNCDAPIEFSSELQQMTCEYCGNVMTIEEAEAQLEQYKVEVEDKTEVSNEQIDVEIYVCDTCGAEVYTDENTSATFCSYCGNPTLIRRRFEGVLSPKYVIPFKISKKEAQSAYKAWISKGGVFTPKEFKSQAMLDKITGLYAPFWLYDYKSKAVLRATGKKVRRTREGDYMCTYTSYYDVYRDFTLCHDRIPADASEKLPDNIMDLLEPFNYKEMEEFKLPYISGYYADKYEYSAEEMSSRVEGRVEDYVVKAGRNTITGYDSVIINGKEIKMTKENADYVLLPIWILNYTYKGKKHTFTMNGQTGKIVADLPKSKKLMLQWFAGIAGGSFAILSAIYLIAMML